MKILTDNMKQTNNKKSNSFALARDQLWLYFWMSGIFIIWLWNYFFLNAPARHQVETAFLNMIFISTLVIILSVLFALLYTLWQQFFKIPLQITGRFLINLVRSIPQIVGILIGYVFLTILIQNETIQNEFAISAVMALILSIFIFPELSDLLIERIEFFKKSDFYNAMIVCGISKPHIILREILFRNSAHHITNKLISIFGMAIFLQCSIDFIISVGLSTEVSSVNFPITLGSLLAKIDSKQDILAIGYAITHWSHIDNLFFEHLQGITVAFLIVFTLLCLYHISNGYARRHRL
jgi:ABC-type dipeptide/oligopeptide/nickel transport system permease subunit